MGNMNYDSFYKFLVSLGIILVILPWTVLMFLTTNSFDLQITEVDLAQYTQTAQKVIALRQSLPLLVQEKYTWWIIGGISIFGIFLILYGLRKWYELQKIDDICKKREVEKQREAIEKNTVKMSDEQILQKTNFKDGPRTAAMKGFIIEQKFVDFVKNTKKTYIVKNNIMIGTHEYDVVAFSNKTFEKDFVYEVKYLRNNISLHQIERYREQLKKLRTNFSEELNRLPYMTLAIVVPDERYEYTVNIVKQIKKWNNYSIEIMKESDL